VSCVVLLLAAAMWRREDLAYRYHLFRLRRDPARLELLYDRRHDAPVRRAIDAYTEDVAAQEAWLRIRVEREAGDEWGDAVNRLVQVGTPGALEAVAAFVSVETDEDESPGDIAAVTLARAGPRAFKRLALSLRDLEEHVAWWRVRAIGRAGAAGRPALEALLTDRERILRAASAQVLGNLRGAAAPAVPKLVKALTDSHESVRSNAADSLGDIGVVSEPVVAGLCRGAADPDLDVSSYSRQSLVRLGPQALWNSVPHLRELLRSEALETRASAAEACAELGRTVSSQLVDEFSPLLRADDEYTCIVAAQALAVAGPVARAAIPDLMRFIDAESDWTRVWALRALIAIGPASVPALRFATRTDSVLARANAASVLGKLGAAARPAVSDLIRLLSSDRSTDVRWHAALAVGAIGVEPLRCIPALLEALDEDADASVRRAAVIGLGRFPDTGPRLFAELLRHDELALRLEAVRRLVELVPAAADAVPRLTECVATESDPLIRSLAIVALGEIGPAAAPAVETLVASAKNGDYQVRSWVFEALGKIGPDARAAIPVLEAALDDENPVAREAARKALASVRGQRIEG